jgi:hypothetical protein
MANPYAMNGLAQGLAGGLQAYLQAQESQRQRQMQEQENSIINSIRLQQMQQNNTQFQRETEQYDYAKSLRPLQQNKLFVDLMDEGPDRYNATVAGMPNAPQWMAPYQKPLTPQEQAQFVAGLAGKVGTEGAGYLASGAGMQVPGFNAPLPGQQQAPSWNTPDELANAARLAKEEKARKEARYNKLQEWIKDKSFFDRPKQDKQFLLQERSLLQKDLYGKGSPMNEKTGQYIEPERPPMSDAAWFSAANALQAATDAGSPDLINLIASRMGGGNPMMPNQPMPFQFTVAPTDPNNPPVLDAPGGALPPIPAGTPPTAPGNPMKITPEAYSKQAGTGFTGMRPSAKSQRAGTEFGWKAEDRPTEKAKDAQTLAKGKQDLTKGELEIEGKKQGLENAKTDAQIKAQALAKAKAEAKTAKGKAKRIYEGNGEKEGGRLLASGIISSVAGVHAKRVMGAMIRQGLAKETNDKTGYEATSKGEETFGKRIAELNKQYPAKQGDSAKNLKGDDKGVYDALQRGASEGKIIQTLMKHGWSARGAKAKVDWLKKVR